MKDLISAKSIINATAEVHQFWRHWGMGETPASRYRQILQVAETADDTGVFQASVAMEDWHSGFRSFIKHLDQPQQALDELAPIIAGGRQPQVPLPFQGNLKDPKLVILASNPQNDTELLQAIPDLAFKTKIANLAHISGKQPLPGNFAASWLQTPGTWLHDSYAAGPDFLVDAQGVGNATQFGIRDVARVAFFPYRSGIFSKSPYRYFNAHHPQNWLPSQKLMLQWLAALIRHSGKLPEAQQPIFVARQETNWKQAVHLAIERSDYPHPEALIARFDARLFYLSSGGARLSRNNIISATAIEELARIKKQLQTQGKTAFQIALDAQLKQV